jgi:5-methylcytosine-specific restriction endonuclease McrA
MVLLLQRKAELVEAAAQRLRAQTATFVVPLVVRLVRYVAIPRHRKLLCSRRAVLARDRETCQYCGAQPGRAHLTIDHVLPRAQAGTTSWENVVAACANCNHRKANRTPQQAGLALIGMPRRPSYVAGTLLSTLERHATWQKYAYQLG